IQDGWYNTGDFARIDEEGFIQITGRQSRFSKIGGEMVPHIGIEEQLCRIISCDTADEDDGRPWLAVTAVPDPRRGERLVVIHRPGIQPPDQLIRELAACELPNLWLPDAASFLEVNEIPVLGTGKLDLKGVADVAKAHFAAK
ncbi:MAG: acyl-[ACP]--phospholipid O-acyltransferase, partial [Planctomycetales bacterium]|nr:acyl-[ACP]--phospholipid O-acyltransferase [Planctomycetales bacterium]